jgi:uncharacterized protein (TIGR04255 family)
MTDERLKRPHFRKPPIFEQAIAVVFERQKDFSIVDPGLFWREIIGDFPKCTAGAKLPNAVELFDRPESQAIISVIPAAQLPRTVYLSAHGNELIQLQDDKFVFNWVRETEDAEYPRFERTSERFWKFFELWARFSEGRHGSGPALKQCELTNVNVIPVNDFGRDFEDMYHAFIVDPFDWQVPGLVAETYVRQRVHRIVDDQGEPLGRLHSTISPVYGPDGEKAFQFELTARSTPTVKSVEAATEFFERAHMMINGAFIASVTKKIRNVWGELTDGE